MIAGRNSKPPPQPLFKDTPTAAPKAAFISLSFHRRRVLFRFPAAAQASLHRPAPRTRSRATLIPLLRPLDRRKGLLSHISPVSSTALIVVCRQPHGVFGICASPPQLPLFATAVLFSAAALTFSAAAALFSAAAYPPAKPPRRGPLGGVTPRRASAAPSVLTLPPILLCLFAPTTYLTQSFSQLRFSLLPTSKSPTVKQLPCPSVASRALQCIKPAPTVKHRQLAAP